MARSVLVLVLGILLCMSIQALCSPPPSPIKCRVNKTLDCNVTNAYGTFPDRSTCHAAEVAYPTSEEEIMRLVASASAKKQKMRVITLTAHSVPKLVCAGGNEGLVISTNGFDKVLKINTTEQTITVQSGITLRQLINAAAGKDLALPHSPYWEGLTVGGMLGTGAHGSSLFGKGSAVHEYVTSMRVVSPIPQGDASIVVFDDSHPDFDAAKVSLGLLGVVTQVTFKLQPMFKRSMDLKWRNETNFESNIEKFGKEHEFADFTWYPAQKSVVYRIDDRVDTTAPGDGVHEFIGFRPTPSAIVSIIRLLEEGQEKTRDGKGKCAGAKLQVLTLQSLGYGFKNNDLLFLGFPVVGYQHKMQTSGSCLYSKEDALLNVCSWDPRIKGLFYFQNGVRIALNKVEAFVSDLKQLRDMMPEGLCGLELYSGIIMRFVKASSAYLGADEDSVDFDITYYRSRDPMVPRLNEDVLEEMEQMALFKYGGVPHLGKNRQVAFINVTSKYKDFSKFREAMTRYDPMGLLRNEWTDALMGIEGKSVVISKDGCALEGLCICSEDRHCAPSKGYFCRPGRVYQDAMVCRHEKIAPNSIESWTMQCHSGFVDGSNGDCLEAMEA